MLGQTISHYRILHELGRGGMGVVYEAEDTRLGRRVALKFLPPALSQDAQAVSRFLREARAASGLNHSNICTIYDIGEVVDDDPAGGSETRPYFIVMERLEGQTLKERTDGRPLAVDTIVDLAVQIADALAAAHAGGIVHRDIKPANVFVTRAGQAKLLDFGIAKLTGPSDGIEMTASAGDRLTNAGTAVGTVAYMSPEQALGRPLDARTDLYSFGLVLYEMATGRQAFSGATSAAIFDRVLHHSPVSARQLNPEIPLALEQIIARATEKDPEVRYQTASDLRADLKRVQRDHATAYTGTAPRETTPAPKPKRVASRRTLIAAGAVALALLAVLGAYWWASSRTVVATVGASGRPAVAVLAFDNPGRSADIEWLTRGLSTMLVTGLAQTPGLDVVGMARVEEILKDLGNTPGGGIDRSQFLEAGRRAGAGAIVAGSVFKAGSDFRIDVRIEDVATGNLVSAYTVHGADVFPLIDDLAGRVRQSLNVAATPASPHVASVTSQSLEAYRLYLAGVDAVTNLRIQDARDLLQKAVSLDPTFAAAYLQLSDVTRRLGDEAGSEQYRRQARAHLDRLSERERWSMQAADASRNGNSEEAIRILQELITRYPDADTAYVSLSNVYGRVRHDRASALDVLERAVKAVPASPAVHNNHAYILAEHGRLPEAVRAAETYVRLRPREPNAYDTLADMHLQMGDPERAADGYAQATSVDPSFAFAYFGRTWSLAMTGRYDQAFAEQKRLEDAASRGQFPAADAELTGVFLLTRVGRFLEAERRLDRAVTLAQQSGDAIRLANWHALAALVALERQQDSAAIERSRLAEAPLPQVRVARARSTLAVLMHRVRGTALARTGDTAGARAILAAVRAAADPESPNETQHGHILDGEIALAAGDLAAADRAFGAAAAISLERRFGPPITRTVLENGFAIRDGAARLHAARGATSDAVAAYRALLRRSPGQRYIPVLEPRYVLALARLLDRAGDKTGARQEYARFVDLWKNADADVPELAEARKLIASTR